MDLLLRSWEFLSYMLLSEEIHLLHRPLAEQPPVLQAAPPQGFHLYAASISSGAGMAGMSAILGLWALFGM